MMRENGSRDKLSNRCPEITCGSVGSTHVWNPYNLIERRNCGREMYHNLKKLVGK